MDKNTLIILGSGTSTGIPMLGCQCEVCTSKKSENQRTRTSILLQINGKNIIVDTTPDMRTQLLRENILNIDGAIITHDHADHVHGIDDLRPFTFDKPMPVITDKVSAKNLKEKFPYIFNTEKVFKNLKVLGGGIPRLNLEVIEGDFTLKNIPFESTLLPHGHSKTLSLIHQSFAYIIDCKTIPNTWIKTLQDKKLDLIIIDCVRYKTHQTHLCFDDAIKFIKLIRPKRAGLIHMAHEIEHFDLINRIEQLKLDIEIFPVFDGMKMTY